MKENSTLTDFDANDYGRGLEGEKKTIIKKAQKSAAKMAYSAQSCLFQLLQQIDTFREQIIATQKKGEKPNMQDLFGIMASFLSGAKAIRSNEEFKDVIDNKF